MAYADQQSMSSRKLTAIGIVAVLHALLGYALVTGLASSVVQSIKEDLNTFDVIEEPPPPPPEDPPPPPPEDPPQTVQPPPLVTPPPIVQTQAPPPVVIQSVPTAPPTPVVTYTAPVAPPTPPAPPGPPPVSKAAVARTSKGEWLSDRDYPAAARRDNIEGKVRVTWNIGADGRIQNCRVLSGSGSSVLDNATCPTITKRARYTPAKDAAGNNIPGGSETATFVWRLTDR